MEHIITDTQTASVRNRTIIENLQINRDIINYAKDQKIAGAIITLDQEKAFDRVSWNLLLKVLMKFNFGEKMCQRIEIIYKNITSKVKVNGHLSQPFVLKRGVRQGCPLSMLLYVILAELFILGINANKKLKGIEINNQEIKISAFADDMTIYLSQNNSLYHLEIFLREYELATGARFNNEKSKGFWLGPNKGRTDQPIQIEWSNNKIKILGYTFGHDEKDNELENWEKTIEKINKSIKQWASLQLSLIGKKMIINQVLLSKIWYLAYVTTPPKKVINRINRMIYDFLWNYKKIRVSRNTITQPIQKGGLGILDLETQCDAIKNTLIKMLIRDKTKNKIWANLMVWHLDKYRSANQNLSVFKTFIGNTTNAKVRQFQGRLLNAWANATNNDIPIAKSLPKIYNEPLFFNRNSIKTQSHSKYLMKTPPKWAGAFKTIGDLCNIFTLGFITQDMFDNLTQTTGKEDELRELIKLVPTQWAQQIRTQTGTIVEENFKITKLNNKNKKVTTEIETMTCRDFYKIIQYNKHSEKGLETKFQEWGQICGENITILEWETIFVNLYKKTKQKEAFDIQYRFLHFAQPVGIKLQEISKNKIPGHCTRCGYTGEDHKHWLFFCPHSQYLFHFTLSLLETIHFLDADFDNEISGCITKPLLQYLGKFPAARDIFETYFLTIREMRKDATYGYVRTQDQELLYYKNKLRQRINYLAKKAEYENELESFRAIWGNSLDRNNRANII